jgi:hypothetical protein
MKQLIFPINLTHVLFLLFSRFQDKDSFTDLRNDMQQNRILSFWYFCPEKYEQTQNSKDHLDWRKGGFCYTVYKFNNSDIYYFTTSQLD